MRSKETFMILAIIAILLQITSGSTSPNTLPMSNSPASIASLTTTTNEEDLRILVYRDVGSAIQATSISDLISILNTTYASVNFLNNPSEQTDALNQAIIDQVTQELLVDAVIFFGSEDNISVSGAKETFQKFLARGGGIIVAGTSGESDISRNLNNFLSGYGIEIGTENAASVASLVPDPYILVRDFAPSYLPFIENLTQFVFHGANVTLDTAQEETEDGLEILFSYPLCYSDGEALAATRETLGVVTELERGGRLITLGSSFMFNDTFIRTAEEENSQEVLLRGSTANATLAQLDNWLLVKNLIEWVSGSTGKMNFAAPAIGGYDIRREQDHVFHALVIGKPIWGRVNLTSWENETLSHTRVELYIRILDSFLRSSVMSVVDSQQYNGSVSTKDIGIDRGWVTIGFVARAQGYGRIFLEKDEISRVWVEKALEDPAWPAMSIWVLFAAGSLVFFSMTAAIWKILKEIEKRHET